MQKNTFAFRNIMAALAVSTIIVVAPLGSALAADAGKDRAEAWAQHRQEWMRAQVGKDANRLEIKASQQAAWEEYANARKALADGQFTQLPKDADAAAIARHRAEKVSELAQKLTALADATAKLQAVLSPEQRKTLDQIVRHGHWGHGHGQHGFFGHEHGLDAGQQGKTAATKAPKPQAEAPAVKK